MTVERKMSKNVVAMQTARAMHSDRINLAGYTFKDILYKRRIYVSRLTSIKKQGNSRLYLSIKSAVTSFSPELIS